MLIAKHVVNYQAVLQHQLGVLIQLNADSISLDGDNSDSTDARFSPTKLPPCPLQMPTARPGCHLCFWAPLLSGALFELHLWDENSRVSKLPSEQPGNLPQGCLHDNWWIKLEKVRMYAKHEDSSSKMPYSSAARRQRRAERRMSFCYATLAEAAIS